MDIDILKIKRKLLVKYPTFGSIVANTTFIANVECETAETDGKNVYYNPEFVENLTVDERTFLFAHEICHIAFDHIFRSEGKIHKLWNIATDGVINALLQSDGLPLIEGGVDIKEAINYDAEQLYEKLKKEEEEKNSRENGSSSSDVNDSDNSQVGHDNHTIWSDAVKKRNNQNNNNSPSNDNSNDTDNKTQKKIREDIDKMREEGEKKTFDKNKEKRKKYFDELKESLKKPNESSSTHKRNVNNIGTSYPLINWRYLLREAVKIDVDWTYQNATIENGVVTAHLEEIPQPETEIVLDTSGSIDEELLRNFLRECKNILQTSKVYVGCFDTKFYGFHEIRGEVDIDTVPLEGGGGTNFDVAVDAFSNRVENKIIFTDGLSTMPKESIDAIWIVFGGRKINPKGGKVINISDEDLRKLRTNYGGRTR